MCATAQKCCATFARSLPNGYIYMHIAGVYVKPPAHAPLTRESLCSDFLVAYSKVCVCGK